MGTARETLSVSLFGAPRFATSAKPLDLALSKTTLAVLAYLLVFRDEALKRDRVAFAVWPDDEETNARANLRRHLYLLTRALPAAEPPWLIADARTVRWNADAAYVLDLETFERGIADPSRRAEALTLYSADLLEGFDAEWLDAPRNRYRELFCAAALEEANAAVAAREFSRAVALSLRVLAVDPWHEIALRTLITARHASGDRAGALAAFADFERRLREEFEAAPMPETQQLVQQLRDATETIATPSVPATLPTALTMFVDRESESAAVRSALLGAARVVTITGPGGVGKSRLAVEVATSLRAGFEGEPIFVQLTQASDDRRSVEGRILDAFGIAPGDEAVVDVVARVCGSKAILIVIDNADRVTRSASEVVADLIARAPSVRILVTSQRKLRLTGEQVIVLAPLPESASVVLFFDRAKSLDANFVTDVAQTREAASICRRLDGMPLSIELAAARTNVLSLSEIDARLSDRFALLRASGSDVRATHRTLHATLEWSFDSLDEPERTLFRRLAAFASGWSFAGASALGAMQPGDQIDVLESLSGLIEKSLVVTSHGTATRRYAYLETVRAYALERLRESGELAQAEAALVSYYARFVAERRPSFATKGEKAAFDEIAIEHGNIVAALDSAIERGHAEPAAAIACDLAPFWIARGLASEIQPRLDALLRSDDAYDITLRSKLWNVSSLVHFRQGAIAEAARRAERALEFATESTDAGAIADALVSRARCRYSLGEFSEASEALERALPLYLQANDRVGEARVLNFMAIVADENGDVAATDSLLRRSLAVYESCGDLQGIATVNYHLSFSAYERGDWPAAIAFSTKALDLWRECGNLQGEAWAQYNLGCAEAKQGAVESAASRLLACVRIAQRRGFQRELGDGLDRLAALLVEREPALSTRSLAYAARLRDLNGNVVLPIEREGYEACVRTARERLGPANFEIAWQQGRMDDEARLVDELASAIEETSYTTS